MINKKRTCCEKAACSPNLPKRKKKNRNRQILHGKLVSSLAHQINNMMMICVELSAASMSQTSLRSLRARNKLPLKQHWASHLLPKLAKTSSRRKRLKRRIKRLAKDKLLNLI